ncbi:unnamed protein product [Pleuronectes platessa]|uniref:Uncharacterized protein n=1 Tax=Pleuronectes platessa TaxID=8262 RepID=A0A9N7U459_PLEPL|nr:unnamed protein product [Pleuronectes platessa]
MSLEMRSTALTKVSKSRGGAGAFSIKLLSCGIISHVQFIKQKPSSRGCAHIVDYDGGSRFRDRDRRDNPSRAPGDQPQVHPESHSLPVPHRRFPSVVSHPPTSEVLTVASAPVPAPRRRFPSDVSSLLTSEVLTAAAVPVPAPRWRFQPDVHCVSPLEVLAAPAPVPVPRRRLPADVSHSQTSEVLTAASASVPVPRRRLLADIPCVPASEVFASLSRAGGVPADATLVPVSEVFAVPAPVPAPVSAPVPVPRRRVPADATLVPASEIRAVPAPVPAPCSGLRSELLPSGPDCLRATRLRSSRAWLLTALPSLRTLSLIGHGAAQQSP